jgi:hypothetical protein
MTRNQKIALGCGGAGCLGLIVVGVAGVLIYYFALRPSSGYYASYNDNYNRSNLNLNDNENTNGNENTSSSSSSSADDSMTEDDKHKLFQAAAMTGDTELQRRVWVKIGIVEADYTPGQKYEEFVSSHVAWAARNFRWMTEMNSEEKARAYVNEHLD